MLSTSLVSKLFCTFSWFRLSGLPALLWVFSNLLKRADSRKSFLSLVGLRSVYSWNGLSLVSSSRTARDEVVGMSRCSEGPWLI